MWSILLVLLAVGGRHRNTWWIDADNVLGHRGTPASMSDLVNVLQAVQASRVVLVEDGRKERESSVSTETNGFCHVQLAAGLSADDWMLEELLRNSSSTRIHVVTADGGLRRRVLAAHKVKAVVDPVVFWRRYVPRLSGWKHKKR